MILTTNAKTILPALIARGLHVNVQKKIQDGYTAFAIKDFTASGMNNQKQSVLSFESKDALLAVLKQIPEEKLLLVCFINDNGDIQRLSGSDLKTSDEQITQAREEVIKMCQKEMYESLEEVAQYGNSLVNKHDIKVWIYNLPSSINQLSNEEV